MAEAKPGEPAEDPRPATGRRLPSHQRREQILAAAVAYFAENGFEGGTRGVAERLGVSQPLIYRYFATKEDLIRAVYDRIYLARWQNEWSALLTDRAQPLRARLVDFYTRYSEIIFDPEWMRIHVFSGLQRLSELGWWFRFVEENVLATVCNELRASYDQPSMEVVPIQDAEIETYWHFHGGILFYGMRREVYGAKPRSSPSAFIANSVDTLLMGYPAVLPRLAAASADDEAGLHSHCA